MVEVNDHLLSFIMGRYKNVDTIVRFDYLKNILIYLGKEYDLDELRAHLLNNHGGLCDLYKIQTINHSGKFIVRSLVFINGVPTKRKEIFFGQVQKIYDYDGLFSHAERVGIINNFLMGEN